MGKTPITESLKIHNVVCSDRLYVTFKCNNNEAQQFIQCKPRTPGHTEMPREL